MILQLTIGAGIADSEFKDSAQDSPSSNGFHVGFSAVTGDLTVAAGYANGDKVRTSPEIALFDATTTKVGVKYVAGDVTLSAGFTSGEVMTTLPLVLLVSTEDTKDVTEFGISYAVASGVTANLGW